MSGDAHVQFWEGLGVRLPGATQLWSDRVKSLFNRFRLLTRLEPTIGACSAGNRARGKCDG